MFTAPLHGRKLKSHPPPTLITGKKTRFTDTFCFVTFYFTDWLQQINIIVVVLLLVVVFLVIYVEYK